MSNWTYVNGIITVKTMGRTSAESEYILKTVLEHLPRVEGSEEDMMCYIVTPKSGHYTSFSRHNEYGERSKTKRYQVNSTYYIAVNGELRDTYFSETCHSFQKWICRLAKRVTVTNILVSILDRGSGEKAIIDNYDFYNSIFENPSWVSDNKTVNWCEYLMWNYPRDKDGDLLKGKPDFPDGSFLEVEEDDKN